MKIFPLHLRIALRLLTLLKLVRSVRHGFLEIFIEDADAVFFVLLRCFDLFFYDSNDVVANDS